MQLVTIVHMKCAYMLTEGVLNGKKLGPAPSTIALFVAVSILQLCSEPALSRSEASPMIDMNTGSA